jgi:phage tail sheath gpL-like
MPLANPIVTASLRSAGGVAGLTPERILVVGSKRSSGTATSGALNINIGNDHAEDTLFGIDSPLAAAIRRIRLRNKVTQVDAIGLSDAGGGVAATGSLIITGTATATDVMSLQIGSDKYNSYSIPITVGDTSGVVALAIANIVNADTKSLVTGSVATGTVTFTAKNLGTFGNTIGMQFDKMVAGLNITKTSFFNGLTDPTLTGVFDVVGNRRYQGVVWQFSADVSALTAFLDARFNVTNDVLDGVGFVSKTDTLANLLTTLNALNSKNLCFMVDKRVGTIYFSGPAVFEVPFVKAAEFAAIRALRRTEDAVLGDLVISRSAVDSFGGPWQNSKPYFNTPFPDCTVPDPGNSFSDTEINQIITAGGWVVDANRAYTAAVASNVTTTYKTDAGGNPDSTFKYLNYVDTACACREYIVNNTRAKYPQYRATSGALIPGVDSANEASLAAYVGQLYSDLGDMGLVNTGTGTVAGKITDFDKSFRQNLVVTLNPVTGKFLVSAKLHIVNQLREIAYDLAVAFEV